MYLLLAFVLGAGMQIAFTSTYGLLFPDISYPSRIGLALVSSFVVQSLLFTFFL